MNEIIELENKMVLMWVEHGSIPQGYRLFVLGSRYDDVRKVKIPNHVIKRIKENATDTYPIMIVDGYDLDALFDKIALKERGTVFRSWGDYPRKVTGYEHKNSVVSFIKDVIPEKWNLKELKR